MKKLYFVLALALFFSAEVFAEPMAMTLMGKIKSINIGNAQNGMKTELVIIDGAGKESKSAFSSMTKIADKTGKQLAAEKLVAGENVKVNIGADKLATSVEVEG